MSIDSIWFSKNNFACENTLWSPISSGCIENVKHPIPKYSCLKIVT